MNQYQQIYFALWAIVLPVASLLVLPGIQGTTPANLLALGSIIWLPFIRRSKARSYLKALGYFVVAWVFFVGLAQLGIYLIGVERLPQILSIDYFDSSTLFRRSIATQSAYLVACFLSFLFFFYIYQSTWRKYIFWGAWVLVGYGLYEWFYFLIMRQPGDFLANRTFMEGEHTGSWSQIITLGKFEFLRIKSTTGEPSFFALAGMPYLVLALESRKWVLAGLLLVCHLLSLSTTAYLALFIVGAFSIYYFQAWKGKYLAMLIGFVAVAVAGYVFFPDFFDTLFARKFAAKDASGQIRQHIYLLAYEYWSRLNIWNKLVGIGFGSAFVTPLIGGILINTGLLGVAGFLTAFGYPIYRLSNTPENWALKAGLISMIFMLCVSVADFTYLTTWMILGLAYRRMRQQTNPEEAPEPERKKTRTRMHSFGAKSPAAS